MTSEVSIDLLQPSVSMRNRRRREPDQRDFPDWRPFLAFVWPPVRVGARSGALRARKAVEGQEGFVSQLP
jgi:hypothetical protein